jgi:hypothetical protein
MKCKSYFFHSNIFHKHFKELWYLFIANYSHIGKPYFTCTEKKQFVWMP